MTFTISLNSLLVKTALAFHLIWFKGRALPPFVKGRFHFYDPKAKKIQNHFHFFYRLKIKETLINGGLYNTGILEKLIALNIYLLNSSFSIWE